MRLTITQDILGISADARLQQTSQLLCIKFNGVTGLNLYYRSFKTGPENLQLEFPFSQIATQISYLRYKLICYGRQSRK